MIGAVLSWHRTFFNCKNMENKRELANAALAWLESDHSSVENILQGIELLRRIYPQRAGMLNTLMRRPERPRTLEKVEYELRKHTKYLVDELDLAEVNQMNAEIMPQIQEAVNDEQKPDHRGIREDHDRLPDNIKALWADAAELWKKIKTVFETCKSIRQACDRYEYLKVLKDSWYEYRDMMKQYDAYVIGNEQAQEGTESGQQAVEPKEVINARSYISKNLPKLTSLHESGEPEDIPLYDSMKEKILKRVDLLIEANIPLSEDLKTRLSSAGIDIK